MSPKKDKIEKIFFKNDLGDYIEVDRKIIEKLLHFPSNSSLEYWQKTLNGYRFKNGVKISFEEFRENFYILPDTEFIEQDCSLLKKLIKVKYLNFTQYFYVENKDKSINSINYFINAVHRYLYEDLSAFAIKEIKINRGKTISLCLKRIREEITEKEIQKILNKYELANIHFAILNSDYIYFYMDLKTELEENIENIFFENTLVFNRLHKFMLDKRNVYYKTPYSIFEEEKLYSNIDEKKLEKNFATNDISEYWFYNIRDESFVCLIAYLSFYYNNKNTLKDLNKSIKEFIIEETSLLEELLKSLKPALKNYYIKQSNEVYTFKISLDYNAIPFEKDEIRKYLIEEIESLCYGLRNKILEINVSFCNPFIVNYFFQNDDIVISLLLDLEPFAKRKK